MPLGDRWSPGMQNSWMWALKTVSRGLSANEGLRQLIAADAGIKRTDWLQLMRWANDAEVRRGLAEKELRSTVLPDAVYTPTPWKIREEYRMIAEVRYWDEREGKYIRGAYSVADTQSKSKELWMSALDIAMERYGEFIDLSSVTVTKTTFWHREL